MESAELRYNCLELAHRLKPGSSDITGEAQKFYDFVEGKDETLKSTADMVLIDRALAEQIASERSDMIYDSANDSYKAAPVPATKDKVLEPA
jgi:hypothetical protein